MKIAATVFALLTLPMLVGAARASGPSLQDRQQAACHNDVMRLCGDAAPNVDQVKACMSDKRDVVSPDCAAFYPPAGKRAKKRNG